MIFPSRRLRATPFTARVSKLGASGFTVYNHMLLPTVFESLQEDYKHLKEYVQIWDVSVERQVQLLGEDAHKLACMISADSKLLLKEVMNLIDEKGFKIGNIDTNLQKINGGYQLQIQMYFYMQRVWQMDSSLK